jgi:hypothetical protein
MLPSPLTKRSRAMAKYRTLEKACEDEREPDQCQKHLFVDATTHLKPQQSIIRDTKSRAELSSKPLYSSSQC